MSITSLPPLDGFGDDEPRHAPVYDINRRCAHPDCHAALLVGWLYPLCKPCKAAECLVCGREIVPVDGHLCWVCREMRALFSSLWLPWQDAYKNGVYHS